MSNTKQIYLVGGAVRDKLLGTPSNDKDWLVIGATAQDMLDTGFKAIHAAEFPIFTKDGDEYALARKERKSGKGYKGFDIVTSPDVTLEDDLLRRDLTINSMAFNDKGELIDLYNGQQDIKDRLLRHTSDAFKEDPVRILRVARFMAQLGEQNFRIADETLQLMSDMVVAGEASNLTPERVWKELEKALKSTHPERFFETLHLCGALEVLLPELHNLIDVPQPLDHHPENCVFKHVMLALQQSVRLGDGNPITAFAVLVHDVGKAVSPQDTWPAHHGHEDAGLPLVDALCNRLKVPNVYRNLALKVTEHHLRAHKALSMRPSKVVDMLSAIGALNRDHSLDLFLTACEADAKGRLGLSDRAYPQADYIREIHAVVMALDTKPITEKFKGQGVVIGEQIRLARIQASSQIKESLHFTDDAPRMS